MSRSRPNCRHLYRRRRHNLVEQFVQCRRPPPMATVSAPAAAPPATPSSARLAQCSECPEEGVAGRATPLQQKHTNSHAHKLPTATVEIRPFRPINFYKTTLSLFYTTTCVTQKGESSLSKVSMQASECVFVAWSSPRELAPPLNAAITFVV